MNAEAGPGPAGRAVYVVIGNGPAGVRASETLRKGDRDARVVVVSDEPHPFYNRIPLSKEFLEDDGVDADRVVIKPVEVYTEQNIELLSGVRVERLDPGRRVVTLAGGETIGYDGCVIATGARPLRLSVPGFDLPGVRTLRTLDDAIALRDAARHAERATIIGGGLIGIEVAAALTRRGVQCTLLAREPWLFGHLAPEPVGHALGAILDAGDVRVELESTVVAIDADGETLSVETDDGRTFEGDLVPVGVGVRPSASFLEGTELADARGVHVDACLRTGAPGVVAAGDVAAFTDPLTGVRHRVEHWTHAQHQGRSAAETLLSDTPEPYARVTSYDTKLFGVPIAVVGSPALADTWRVDGALDTGVGCAYGERAGKLVAAFLVGETGVRPRDVVERIENAIEA